MIMKRILHNVIHVQGAPCSILNLVFRRKLRHDFIFENNGVQKTHTLPMVYCGSHTLDVTNLNAMASNLLRTRFKS